MKIKLLGCLGALCLILVLMMGNSLAKSQSAATQSATGTFEAAAQMDPVPSDCGNLAEPLEINGETGSFLGAWPILISVSSGAGKPKGVLAFPNQHYGTDARLPGWWYNKIAWFVSESYRGEVKISGYNVKDHSPLYINWKDDILETTAALNPKKSFSFVNGMQGWAFFPSIVWVSKAGCYNIEAEWEGGAWRQIVAVGYDPD